MGVGLTTYIVYFPRVLQEVGFPVPGCPEVAHSAERIREHVMYRHFQSQVTVVQEVAEPLHLCDFYIMHMPAGRIIKHQRTARFDNNT